MVLGTFARKNSKIFWFFARLFVPLQPIKAAQMVELVDTRDLKSLDHCGRTGSSPVPGTRESLQLTCLLLERFFFQLVHSDNNVYLCIRILKHIPKNENLPHNHLDVPFHICYGRYRLEREVTNPRMAFPPWRSRRC